MPAGFHLRLLVIACAVRWVGPAPLAFAEDLPQPPVPSIAPADQRFLTWAARRALEEKVAIRPPHHLTYRPATLADLNCQMAVTLRLGGFRRGVGVSPRLPVCEAVRQAALAALDDAERHGKVDAATFTRLRIEMEAIGDVSPAPTIPSWSSLQSYRSMQRGVHGLVVRFMEAQAALRPSEFIADNTSFQEAVETFAQRANPGGEGVEARFVSWFRTAHWCELTPAGEVIELRRGLVVLPPQAVTRDGLAAAIEGVAEYMIYRQRPSGEFAYQYDPSDDVYRDEVSDVRQAGCAWSLALLARDSGGSAALISADRSLQMLNPRVTKLEGIDDAAFLRATEGSSKLGATALMALALSEHPQAVQHRALRQRLLAAMLWLHTPSGRFITIFPPSLEETGQDYAPGQALLALARVFEEEPRADIAKSFELALPFCRDYFRKTPAPAFAGWQSQAFARMARLTQRREYADFAFEMADWLSAQQLDERNCEWPELHGAIDAYGDGDVGVATASCLEAFTEALLLARVLEDERRAERYESAVRGAARFVLQLQFRREEAFYVRSPRDCVGGVRAAPWDNRIRIEQCAHALRALLRARAVLFP